MPISNAALAHFETVGKNLLRATPAAMFAHRETYYRAAQQSVTLGMACAAWHMIQQGADPLETLYKLQDYAETWTGEWPALDRLIDRLILEQDIQ